MAKEKQIGKITHLKKERYVTKKVRILNSGNHKVVVLTKESQGTMYYRAE